MIKLLTLIASVSIFCIGCGTSDGGSSPSPAATPPSLGEAKLVDSAANIPPCTAANGNELIYFIPDSTFEACNGTSWVKLDLKGTDGIAGVAGKDGAAGKDGKNGVDGKDGANGKDGAAGKDGVNGKDAPVIASNEWYDANTKKYWLRSGMVVGGSACNGAGWSVGDATAFAQAKADGLIQALPSPNGYAWNTGACVAEGTSCAGSSFTLAPYYCVSTAF
jgi:hypothetical protein